MLLFYHWIFEIASSFRGAVLDLSVGGKSSLLKLLTEYPRKRQRAAER